MDEFQVIKCSTPLNVKFCISWSKDNVIALGSNQYVNLIGSGCVGMKMVKLFLLLLLINTVTAEDITYSIFGTKIDYVPAAFADFNSDELSDVFVIKNNKNSVEILLGSETEPFLKHSNLICEFKNEAVTSVVPGDFNGDALMDVLVTVTDLNKDTKINSVRILWGNLTKLNCSTNHVELLKVIGQPLAIDYNNDMIMDLFGLSENQTRSYWIFSHNTGSKPIRQDMIKGEDLNKNLPLLKYPHSHAFLDLNHDLSADIFVSTEDNYEAWLWSDDEGDFIYNTTYNTPLPVSCLNNCIIGQTVFLDTELNGKMDQIVPVCLTNDCKTSSIYVYSSGKWHDAKVKFMDDHNAIWGFIPPVKKEQNWFTNAITLRGGDYNMDGYPDLLATLHCGDLHKVFYLKNVPCPPPSSKCDGLKRTFSVVWDSFYPINNDTILGVFYDFLQNGVLDVIFVHDKPSKLISAYKNNLDYDSNFIKVMVLTGLTNPKIKEVPTPLNKKRKIYGTTFPGPSIWYSTTTSEGYKREGIATQLPQSAYFSLNLPYTLFGLGRTPNFLDNLYAGLMGKSRAWPMIIPNSQLIVVPRNPREPQKWFAQLFVTPSKIILQSLYALLGICGFILLIIIILWIKERRQDIQERSRQAHRFL